MNDHLAPAPGAGLLLALGLLTLATGLVDAASVLGLGHVFTANMTGNVVFTGFALAGAGRISAVDCGAALGAFLAGALLGGGMAARGVSFTRAMALETILLAAATSLAALAGDEGWHRLPLIGLLALAMGVQNASVRKLAIPDLTTTVLTLTLAGLAADSSLVGGTNPRYARRLLSVVLMLVGAVAGARLLGVGLPWALGGAALIVGAACLASTAGTGAAAANPPAAATASASTR